MLKDIYMDLREKQMPIRKRLEKKGTLEIGVVETTPVVWKGRLLRFEWFRHHRNRYMESPERTDGCFRFVDMETGEKTPDFAFSHSFGCCYTENDRMYVYGTRENGGGSNALDIFVSDDLIHWEESVGLLLPPKVGLYNTSVCKGANGYIMAIEIDGTHPMVGTPYTCVFGHSDDLIHWELLDSEEYIFIKEHYTACPVIRYYDGYYYMIYVEGAPHHRWIPYIVRSADLREFEMSLTSAVLWPDDNDKKIINPERFTPEQLAYIENAVNINNSDVDLCEWKGKTVVLYAWGNQFGKEFLALAEYDGSEKEFLQSFFV